MKKPFEDLLVVELGRFVSVPFCAQMFADGGARVIKVEPISGDPYRDALPVSEGKSRQFIIKNRGKESLPLNFAVPEGREVLEELIRRADIFVLNLSPKAAARNGLDYQSVRALNQRVIYGTVSGFGHIGPDAELAGMDVVAQARSGLLASLGAEMDEVPYHSEVQAADYASSMLLFGGICSALYARTVTGEGQEVAVSLLGGALTLQNNSIFHLEDHDQWRKSFVDDDLPQLRKAGASVKVMNEQRAQMRPDRSIHTAHYRVFRASDGFVAVGAGSPATRESLRTLLSGGSEAALSDLPLVQLFAEKPVAHWVTNLRDLGVPVAPVQHIEEMLFDEHVLTEKLIMTIDDPDVGPVRALVTPISLSATPFGPGESAPQYGQHTDQILSEIGMTPDQIACLKADGVVGANGQLSST